MEEVAPPKNPEQLLAMAKTKLPQPKTTYKFHHVVTCITNPASAGAGVCLGCKYFSSCNFGKIEWDETI